VREIRERPSSRATEQSNFWAYAAAGFTVHYCTACGRTHLAHYILQQEGLTCGRLRLKCDGIRAETRFRLSAKRTSPFKSAGSSVLSITGSRSVRISGTNGSNAGYTMFRGSVKGTGYPLNSPVVPSLTLPCITVCHHISTGLYLRGLKPL